MWFRLKQSNSFIDVRNASYWRFSCRIPKLLLTRSLQSMNQRMLVQRPDAKCVVYIIMPKWHRQDNGRSRKPQKVPNVMRDSRAIWHWSIVWILAFDFVTGCNVRRIRTQQSLLWSDWKLATYMYKLQKKKLARRLAILLFTNSCRLQPAFSVQTGLAHYASPFFSSVFPVARDQCFSGSSAWST